MNKTFALIVSFIFLLEIAAKSQEIAKRDTSFKNRLTPTESKLIKNLIRTDSSMVPSQINLPLELFKYDANLLYKYRLDSIKTEIPLDYNPYVQSFIDVFLAQRKQQIGKMLALGNYYFPIFEQALNSYHIPKEFKYLPIVESSLDPHAVSHSGATGLWQFMYTTGKGYGLAIDNYVDERKDPIRSSYAAAKYLQEAYNSLGDWLLALASYNCGQGAVSRAMAKVPGAKTFWDIQQYLPAETRSYVPKFIAVTYMMEYANRYNDIQIPDADMRLNTDSIYVSKYVKFANLAETLHMGEDELSILNPEYKKNLVNGSSAQPKRLIIPKIDFDTYASLFDVLNTEAQSEIIQASVIDEDSHIYVKKKSHTVAKGEDLKSIARLYKVEAQDLKVWNNLKTFAVVPGQKLSLEPQAVKSKNLQKSSQYLTYTVKFGDTLMGISRKFEGVSVSALQQLNSLKNYEIKIGMVLKINLL